MACSVGFHCERCKEGYYGNPENGGTCTSMYYTSFKMKMTWLIWSPKLSQTKSRYRKTQETLPLSGTYITDIYVPGLNERKFTLNFFFKINLKRCNKIIIIKNTKK